MTHSPAIANYNEIAYFPYLKIDELIIRAGCVYFKNKVTALVRSSSCILSDAINSRTVLTHNLQLKLFFRF